MAKKRFTDIEIWDKEWYMELNPTLKCLTKYIFDKCDASGCWKPNWKLASLHINDTVTIDDLKRLPKDQYEVLENGKIFIPDFINFQYGTLSEKSPAHNPVFTAIIKNNLSNRVFNRVLDTPKDKDKEKDIDKDKDKGIVLKEINDNKFWFLKFYHANYESYVSVFNGQSTNEIMFLEWKEFIDFIYKRKYEEIFECKFISPHDYAKLVDKSGFSKDKWDETIKSLLSTGIKPEHNLFFRIPQFMKYANRETQKQASKPSTDYKSMGQNSYSERIKFGLASIERTRQDDFKE